jgi:hypothetical protein
LVDNTKDNNLDSEIAKRLDDLFGEGDGASDEDLPIEADDKKLTENAPQEEEQPAADAEILDLKEATADRAENENAPDDHPLAELKNLVLSIDWEITEETLAGLLSEINSLKNTYKKEKIILMFLQLLASLGQYIKTNRGNAHPKTFKILNSVFSRLEEVTLAENMTEAHKKKILRAEMEKYKQLRSKVTKKKAAAARRKEGKAATQAKLPVAATMRQEVKPQDQTQAPAVDTGDSAVTASPDLLFEAVKELKQFIHSELNALKQELKKLQKSN